MDTNIVSWHNLLVCPNLTYLRLARHPGYADPEYERPSPEAFWRSLKQMPLLEEMGFHNFGHLPISGLTASSVREPVLLRHLTHLVNIQDTLPALAEYFGMVQHPGQPKMHLRISDVTWTPGPCTQAFKTFIGNLKKSLSSLSNPKPTMLSITELRIPGRDFGFKIAPHSPQETHSHTIFIVDDRIRGVPNINRSSFIKHFLDILIEEVDFSHLGHLEIHTGDLCLKRCRRLFGHLPQLIQITFSGCTMTTDAFHLQATRDQSSGGGRLC
ncbi:hypothetical protein DFP72DRAFT_1135619 [Ephemerocybe angulata]|uniref:Uncharacterized protein n=1 Tax=Ephemerocybe angulata TaxID=980116 RepID=A0A8H6HRA6_9AGAR|nr:hypothetical protein DFP72DRAFT_1135619 [Tulosesus angulatus]